MPRFSVKGIWNNPEHRTVISNTLSLSGLQMANTLLPIITVPYVVRVIGPGDYGLISFAQAVVSYFILLVNYGFDLSASREVARVREDPAKLTDVFWAVMWTKFVLFVASTIVFVPLVLFVPQFKSVWQVMVAAYIMLVGYLAFPTWLFQGMEKLGLTAIINFILKLAFTACIFLFLRTRDEFVVVPLLGSLSQVVAGVLALAYIKKNLVRNMRLPHFAEIVEQLKSGWTVFISTVFINFYTASNTVILGFFAPQANVGYYAAGGRLVYVVQAMVLNPIAQASYPHVGKLMKEERKRGVEYLKKMTLLIAAATIPASILIFIFAPEAVKILLGNEFLPSIKILRILAPFPFVIGMSNVLGTQGALNLNKDREFLKIIIVGSILNLVLNLSMAGLLKETGTAIAWLVTEAYITVAFFFLLRGAGINIFDFAFYRSCIREWLGKGALT